MFDLPPNLPDPVDPPASAVHQCVEYAAQGYGVHPFVIMAVLQVENGKIGTVSKNSNGSYDLGLMQLNTINLPAISSEFPGVTWREVTYSPCVNIGVGTWFLSERIREVNGDVWRGVGNYHSKTPKYHRRYLNKVQSKYRDIVAKYRKLLSRQSISDRR